LKYGVPHEDIQNADSVIGQWQGWIDLHAVDDFHDHRDLLSSLSNILPLTDRRIF